MSAITLFHRKPAPVHMLQRVLAGAATMTFILLTLGAAREIPAARRYLRMKSM